VTPEQPLDVAIIGAGTAGLSARREVARQTDRYVVIDDGPLGTTCARVGCMPSKVLIQIANDYHRRHALAQMGIDGAEHLTIDRRAAMRHVRALRDRFVRSVMGGMEGWRQTHLLRGRAVFRGPGELEVDGEIVRARRVIIATGSSPLVPAPWRALRRHLIDTDQFFELESLPEEIAVIGLGVIGLELGQALSRLGVRVRAYTRSKALGGLSDPALQDHALELAAAEFSVTRAAVDSLRERDGRLIVRADGAEHAVDKALLGMGRRPNIAGLGLETLGVPLDARGMPPYDRGTYRIEGAEVYFVGDVNGARPLLHEAADQGRIAGYNSAREEDRCFARRARLAITFSDPNIAVVGRSWAELQAEGADFVTGAVSYAGQGRAIVKLEEKGRLHVYVDRQTGALLGAELLAPHGEHLAHLLAWAIAAGLSVREVLGLPFYHPVLEEGVRTALRDAAGQVTAPRGELEVLRCQDPPVGCWS